MSKVITDEKLIDKFLTRGVEEIYPSKEELKKKLMSGERIKAYQGFDPTGPNLHIGHAIGIRALRILQQLGHEVVFLAGDYTAKAGDPNLTGREMLTDEQIERNLQGWKEQVSQIIDFEGDNPVTFGHNYKWLSQLMLEDLIELMSQTTLQQMIERELFQKKLKENIPIGLQELLYPLMQGYDSVAMETDLEIGGTDQTFNMLMGRHLVKKYLNKEKFVRTNEMMESPTGSTMSKTSGNGINLADTSEDMYGKAMSYPDELVLKGLRLLTEVPLEDIYQMDQEMKAGKNPMEFKKLMAFEIVKTLKGDKEAKKAQEYFEKTVQKKDLEIQVKEKISVKDKVSIINILKNVLGNSESSSQIKRVIEQGGVEINGKKVTEPFLEMKFNKGDVIKYGKRKFFEVN